MIKGESLLPVDRFLSTLNIVYKEGIHLSFSWERIFSKRVDAQWVESLDQHPEIAEQLEAFVSRFGRMQDTIADKLLPRWLHTQAEKTGSQIEVLNRAERLHVIQNVEHWLEARKLRNRLVHEYLEAPSSFAEDLLLAKGYSLMLMVTYNSVLQNAKSLLKIEESLLPQKLNFGIIDEEK